MGDDASSFSPVFCPKSLNQEMLQQPTNPEHNRK